MDTTRLERFAKYARCYLMEQVEKKLIQILVYSDGKESEQRRVYPKQVKDLEEEINDTCHVKIVAGSTKIDTKPMQELIEKVAYTWFNRFCALRFMDVNGYNKVNVISPLPGHFQPEILEEAKAGHIDEVLVQAKYRTLVFDLLSGKETHPDPQSEAYRILIRSVCNYYADTMPFLFERIDDWTELLMPDDLLSGNSILAYTREAMVPGVCKDVEVIGWLYQFYIAEKKTEVQDGVKKGKKVQSNDIPAVTQLFTPHWIVKYMVQNSLGRLWLDNHPNSSLKTKMEYYVAQDSDPAELSMSQDRNPALQIKSPEEIKFCDPCCGSGHVLTYAFDLLYEIYSEEGYSPTEIPKLIIEKNLYGIEIDERAAELSALALTMKAREKDKLWFSGKIEPHICCLENISLSKDEIEPYLDRCGRDIFTLNFERMLSQFEYADTYGSLIIPHEQDIEGLRDLLNAKDFSGDVFLAPTHNKVLKLIDQADYLSTKYQVVVTNPPYLGISGFGKEKEAWFKSNYPNSRSDFFAMFMERCLSLSVKQGYIAMINMQSWMFLSSYEKLRKHLVQNYKFVTMAHLGSRAFDSIGGEVVSTTSFVLQNTKRDYKNGAYFRLVDGRSEEEKSNLFLEAISNPDCGWFFNCKSPSFTMIPGTPISYWVSDKIRNIFAEFKTLGDVAAPKQGLATTDNNQFCRFWYELSIVSIGFGFTRDRAKTSEVKWFPIDKGGGYRKWYGNNNEVVNWLKDGSEIKQSIVTKYPYLKGNPDFVAKNQSSYFESGITWSAISSAKLSVRWDDIGFIPSNAGMKVFGDSEILTVLLGLLNSAVTDIFVSALSETINYDQGVINRVPISLQNKENKSIVRSLVDYSKLDWDSYEISWDFQHFPLFRVANQGFGLREAFSKLREHWIERTFIMKDLEEENNLIFIDTYGLKGEIRPKVPLREITLTCNPFFRYSVDTEESGVSELEVREYPIYPDLEKRLLADTMRELISYAVGCMFGRYSLDKPGLILANQGETVEDYLKQVSKPSFMPDKDNVIPILEGDWFDDDIVNRFYSFLKVAFGTDHFTQNIDYIEEAIGKDIRSYFIRDFFNDHVKLYKKRPIYWLFSSPKGSFNALVYMHRYTPDTASIVLSDYLREYVFKLKNKVTELSKIEEGGDSSQKEKIKARKEIDKIEQIISELEYWERDALYPTATQKLSIDLDDGVKVNYAKFSKVLKRVPGLE